MREPGLAYGVFWYLEEEELHLAVLVDQLLFSKEIADSLQA